MNDNNNNNNNDDNDNRMRILKRDKRHNNNNKIIIIIKRKKKKIQYKNVHHVQTIQVPIRVYNNIIYCIGWILYTRNHFDLFHGNHMSRCVPIPRL